MKTKVFFLTALIVLVAPMVSHAAEQCNCECSSDNDATQIEYDLSTHVALSEMLPVPSSGEEEFIELKNTGSASVNLEGWQLRDASDKTYTISAEDFSSVSVPGGGYFVIPQSISKIYLNNDADSLQLIQPNDHVLDSARYEDAEKGVVWVYKGGKWQWSTTVTRGKANVVTTTPVEENNEEDSGGDSAEIDDSKLETSKDVLLNEVLPDPTGLDSTDEWIEIRNIGESSVYLGGWQLTDQSSYYMIGDVSIAAGERLVFEVGVTGISLNNSGDTVYVIDPYGEIVHGTSFEGSTEGMSWAQFDGGDWQWTTEPTPGEENVLVASEEAEAEGGGGEYEEGTDVDVVGVELFRSLEDGQAGSVEGVVTVLPDVFGSQYFYIQDGSAGIQVYSYSKAFPDLSVGDRVRVSGEKSTARGETRVKTQTVEDIVVVGSGETVVPRDMVAIDESLEGMLVQTEGVVTESSSKEAMLNDSLHVVLKENAGIDHDLLEEGESVALIGIAAQYDEDYRMMPRSNEDIIGVEADNAGVPAVGASGGFGENPSSLDSEDKASLLNRDNVMYLLVILGLLGIIAGTYIRQNKEKVLAFLGRKSENSEQKADEITKTQTLFDIARKSKKVDKKE